VEQKKTSQTLNLCSALAGPLSRRVTGLKSEGGERVEAKMMATVSLTGTVTSWQLTVGMRRRRRRRRTVGWRSTSIVGLLA